ncbi:defensin Ec-AMP-D1-like [Miscanthus floridulus]|uniref:defensin Ec-AMP-D1-like n=1 Tax=Miscanthus floridulus TaxID=154761 RepID=UPI0034592B5D
MESSRKMQPVVILLLLLIVATDMAVQARECEKNSERFVGICTNDENCATVCRSEGFMGGRCSTFRRRCICIKPC